MSAVRVPLAAALLGSLACVSVQPLRDPAVSIPKANPQVVFVTYKDNSKIPVSQPHVSGDSLYGTWQGVNEPVATPLSAVRLIEAKQPNPRRTTAMVVGLAALTAGAVWSATLLIGGSGACDSARGNTDQYGNPLPADGTCEVK